MFFKDLLDKMKDFVVIKYRTDDFLDDLKVTFNPSDFLDKDNVLKSNNKINFKQIYENRMI